MDILFLSHCVPNPPDKGEKIRSCHQLRYLSRRHRVHLVCFARSEEELEAARQLESICASVHAELLHGVPALARGMAKFALGGCLNEAYYSSQSMREYIRKLAARQSFDLTFSFTAVMRPYAPGGIPVFLDMIDVDSEKWMDYARVRHPAFLWALEGKRLRQFERRMAESSQVTCLTTPNEERLLKTFAPFVRTQAVENGIDGDYFRSAGTPEGRRIAFAGTMDYHPNREAVIWFAKKVLPLLQRKDPGIEFLIIGRNPDSEVRRLTRLPGVLVTGAVDDIRPYLASARAVVAPLRLARGIQNKVLEALAMGKEVYASPAVANTFAPDLPEGLFRCASEAEYVTGILRACGAALPVNPRIRSHVINRFSWRRNLEEMENTLCQLVRGQPQKEPPRPPEPSQAPALRFSPR